MVVNQKEEDDGIKDLIDLLGLAIKRTSDKLKSLDDASLNSAERKDLLSDIQKQLAKANSNISSIQTEIQ